MSSITSIKVFREFLATCSNNTIDASRIHSIDCYHTWLLSRNYEESDETAKKFCRALSNHVSGVDGRSPFSPQEEFAILKVLRLKQRWPCFPAHISIGQHGYRSKGFHEKQAGAFNSTQNFKRLKACPDVEEKTSSPEEAQIAIPTPDSEGAELKQSDQEYVNSMINQLLSYMRSFPVFHLEVWKSIFSIYRMVVLSRSPASQKLEVLNNGEYIERLCQETSEKKGDGFFVMIYNGVSEDYTNRILAENKLALKWFGDLVGKLTFMLVDSSEAFRVILACLYIVHKPGREYQLRALKMRTTSGSVEEFDTTFSCDPHTYFLIVVCGKPTVSCFDDANELVL